MTCVCGAVAGALGECADYYHAILSEEQRDPEMWSWHAPVVCAYLLQHPAEGHPKFLDVQFRWLQLLLDQGIDALVRVAAHQKARNRHGSRQGYDMAPFEKYAPSRPPSPRDSGNPSAGCPSSMAVSSSTAMRAYGRRIGILAEATVEAWRTSR